jgi:hypothetical protein
MKGEYRDTLRAAGPAVGRPWRPNTIVDSAWTLLAGLLKGDGSVRASLFLAVGEGVEAWDTGDVKAEPTAVRLHAERARYRVGESDVRFIDGANRVTPEPTSRLMIEVGLAVPAGGWVLREFGLFGSASSTPDTGYLVNYVVHPVLRLRAGQRLTRRLRFSFRPGGQGPRPDWLQLAHHPLGGWPIDTLDGVGKVIGTALGRAGLTTIKALAQAGFHESVAGLSATRWCELRARARLALRCVAELAVPEPLLGHTLLDLTRRRATDLAAEAAVPLDAVERLQEQTALLQLALDARTLKQLTLAQVRGGTR